MPFDSHGDAVVPGNLYAIGRGTKKIISETQYDIEMDVLLVRRRGSNDSWRRVDEIDPDLVWVPVNADGTEIARDAALHGEHQCEDDPRELVRNAILRARMLRDQLDAIEMELVVKLGAVNDSDLRDEIQQAIHGDGSMDAVLARAGS